VVFPNVGAYGLTASLLGFLSRPAPAELVLRGDRVVSATRLRWDRSDL
jgi:diaminopimelate decarboxylase